MNLIAKDGVKIAYDYYDVPRATGRSQERASPPAGYLVLLHMMPAAKESWKEFAGTAAQNGFASIAIDLRGHGQSDSGPEGYNAFSDEEHQQSIKDIEAAVEFLSARGGSSSGGKSVPPEKITLLGASIGANLAVWYLAEHPEFKKAVCLSAGENYRGIFLPPLLKKLSADQSLLMFSAKDDVVRQAHYVVRHSGDNPSVNTRMVSFVPAGVRKELVIFDQGGHGTDLLPQATSKILEFLKSLV